MPRRSRIRSAVVLIAAAAALAATTYLLVAGITWMRYGRSPAPAADEADPLLDRFMPTYEVAERHHVIVHAPPAVTLRAAKEMDLEQSPIVHAIFRARELVLGADQRPAVQPRGLLAMTTSMGWGVLAELPDHEIVVGAVTQPWVPNVIFRALPPERFAAFNEPGYTKIVWTLRADPLEEGRAMFRTETRVVTTDAEARRRFRWYWARFSPGIILIRRMSLGVLAADAERRVRAQPQ